MKRKIRCSPKDDITDILEATDTEYVLETARVVCSYSAEHDSQVAMMK